MPEKTERALTPKSRLEQFFAKLAGVAHKDLEPKSRLERWLSKIAENKGGGTYIVHTNGDTLDRTWNEIRTASETMPAFIQNVGSHGGSSALVRSLRILDEEDHGITTDYYYVDVEYGQKTVSFRNSDPDGYPSRYENLEE